MILHENILNSEHTFYCLDQNLNHLDNVYPEPYPNERSPQLIPIEADLTAFLDMMIPIPSKKKPIAASISAVGNLTLSTITMLSPS